MKEQKQQELITIGYAQFKPTTNRSLLKPKYLVKLLLRKAWFVPYFKDKFKEIAQNMVVSTVQQFYLHGIENPQIIESIYHIDFKNLQILGLTLNNITNIEALAWLSPENLNKISLTDNRISRINVFDKFMGHNLNWINLDKNPIKQTYSLDKVKNIFVKLSLQIYINETFLSNQS